MTKSYKITGVPFPPSFSRAQWSSSYCYTFKNSSEFFILLYFCKSCLQSWFAYNFLFILRFFSSHYPTCQYRKCMRIAGITLKAPPDFFTFMWYSSSTWAITKTFHAMQDMNGTSAKTFSDMRYKTLNALVIHV